MIHTSHTKTPFEISPIEAGSCHPPLGGDATLLTHSHRLLNNGNSIRHLVQQDFHIRADTSIRIMTWDELNERVRDTFAPLTERMHYVHECRHLRLDIFSSIFQLSSITLETQNRLTNRSHTLSSQHIHYPRRTPTAIVAVRSSPPHSLRFPTILCLIP